MRLEPTFLSTLLCSFVLFTSACGSPSGETTCEGGDVSKCEAPITCGNGVKDEGEVCDGSDLAGATCMSLGLGAGVLTCAANCLALDKSGCDTACVPMCGAAVCGVDPVCGASCGTCDALSECQSGACVKTCDLDPVVATTTIDVALKTATVSGNLTLDGAPLPDNGLGSSSRGSLRFRDRFTGSYLDVSVGPTGATYSLKLLQSTYDVDFIAAGSSYQNVLPEQNLRVASGLVVSATATRDISLKTATVSGNVTLDAAPLPSNGLGSSSRGSLRFRDRSTGSYLDASLGPTGTTYSLKVFQSTYDVDLIPAGGSYQNVLPEQNLRVASGLAVSATATKDVPLKTATVSGNVTLDAAPLPSNGLGSSSRGSLRFRDRSTGSYLDASLGPTGATYSLKVFQSTYDVDLIAAGGSYQNVLPEQNLRVVSDLTVMATAMKDIPLKTATVSGNVTLDAAPLPSNGLGSSSRGSLRFRDRFTGSYLDASLGPTGATYSLKVFQSTYDVDLIAAGGSYQNVLPEQNLRVVSGLAVSAAATKDIPLKTATVSGNVSLDGAPLPSNGLGSSSRGSLRFRDRSTSSYTDASLGPTGATYSRKVFQSTYDIEFVAAGSSYQNVVPAQNMRARRGCFQPPSCSQSTSDITGSWSVTMNETAAAEWLLGLNESMGQLSGSFFSYSGGSGSLSGARTGDDVVINIRNYACQITLTGHISAGCSMSGAVEAVGSCGAWDPTAFVAFR